MKKSKQQKQAKERQENRAGLRSAITVAAAVASLGASLGVDVERVFAAPAGQLQSSEAAPGAAQHKGESNLYKDQLPAVQHKGESNLYKDQLPAVQHKAPATQHKVESPASQIKGEATQLKYERANANFMKWNNRRMKNGDTFILIGNKPYFRTPGGVQSPAPDGNYEFQNGKKFSIKGGKIVQ